MIVKIKKLNEKAVIPFKKHQMEDACYDLVPVSYTYNPKYDRFEYKLGFATEFSPDWEAEIRPRSTNTKTDAYIPNAPGTIDADYRGEVKVILVNLSNDPFVVNPGERVAQLVLAKYEKIEWDEVEILDETARGEGGFGSTGR